MNPAMTQSGAVKHAQRAVTLLELLIAVSLTMIIVLALYQMFARTQKVLRSSMVQGDLTENGRVTLDLMHRELETMTPGATALMQSFPTWSASYNYSIGYIVYYAGKYYLALAANINKQPDTNPAEWCVTLPNVHLNTSFFSPNALHFGNFTAELDDVYFLSFNASKDATPLNWTAIGYRVASTNNPLIPATNGIGTLYRFSTNVTRLDPSLVQEWVNYAPGLPLPPAVMASSFQRVADGVVHLKINLYTNGVLVPMTSGTNLFSGTNLPSMVQLEIAFLDGPTYGEAGGLPTVAAVTNYLAGKTNSVHIFSTVIPIRTTLQ